MIKTFKNLFRAIKHRLRKKGILSPTGDVDLPKLKKGYDAQLGSCLELEYAFEVTEQYAGCNGFSGGKSVSLGHKHVRVCMSVNSIILLALRAQRSGYRQDGKINMVAYVSKITLNPSLKIQTLG